MCFGGGIFSTYFYPILLIFFTQVINVLLTTTTVKYNEYVTDMGRNITIPCTTDQTTTVWIKEEDHNQTRQFHSGSNLIIENISPSDAGFYICLVSTSSKDGIDAIDHDNSTEIYESVEDIFIKILKIKLIVRTVPGPVSRLTVRISTILGVLIWDYKKNSSGGYPLKSFTSEFRKYTFGNDTPDEWERLDPINISPNIRYMEIYHLLPNTTYEFRIWGNNYLGSGEIVTTSCTTLAEIGDEELFRILMKDAKDFDTIVWFYAVSIVMGSMVMLGLTVCLLLVKDCYEQDELNDEDEWETLDLIPNIILNPGFFEPDDPDNPSPPYTRTIIFGEDVLSSSEDESEEESIPFKRKLSIFFTGDTIKRL